MKAEPTKDEYVLCTDDLKSMNRVIKTAREIAKQDLINRTLVNEVIDRLADLEHKQWMQWSKTVMSQLLDFDTDKEIYSETTIAKRVSEKHLKWLKYWKSYYDLTEEEKELDRIWAREALSIVLSAQLLMNTNESKISTSPPDATTITTTETTTKDEETAILRREGERSETELIAEFWKDVNKIDPIHHSFESIEQAARNLWHSRDLEILAVETKVINAAAKVAEQQTASAIFEDIEKMSLLDYQKEHIRYLKKLHLSEAK